MMFIKSSALLWLALLLAAGRGGAVLSPAALSDSEILRVRSSVAACRLEKLTRKPPKPSIQRGPKQLLGACPVGKYSKAKCLGLRREGLSRGCRLLDLQDARWYGGAEAREVVLYGDSVMHQIFFSLVCQVARHAPVEPQKGGFAPGEGCKKDCFRFGALAVCMVRVPFVHLSDRSQPALCLRAARPQDVHVFNGGVHVNNRRLMESMMSSFQQGIQNMTASGLTLPHLVWRESTPQHFMSPGGHYVGKSHVKRTRRCMPLSKINAKVMRNLNFRKEVTMKHLQGMNISIFHIWEMLLHRPDLHPSPMDCTHWCDTPNSPLAEIGKLLLSDLLRTYWGGVGKEEDGGVGEVPIELPVAS